ncbi:MAG: hypothetical protein JNM75_05455 [Rhodospirillales bacterium]|nr:hypothetical protein [Rhodospirillales bacterium]
MRAQTITLIPQLNIERDFNGENMKSSRITSSDNASARQRFSRILFTSALLAAIFGAVDASASPCTNILTSAETTPAGYGSAYNRLTSAKEFLIQGVECDADKAEVSVGSGSPEQYVYKNAFYWTGSKWQEMLLSGSTLVSDTWYKGGATGSMPLGALPNYVLGYVCQRDAGQWKCGCSDETCSEGRWQMQALANGSTGGGGGSTASCLARPSLSNPMVVDGDGCPGNINGQGGDLLVKMPKKVCKTQLSISNARNVQVIGGHISLGADVKRAVSFANIKGHAHVKGMHLDVQNRPADGIRIYNSPKATLTVQNSLIEGLGGEPTGTHGDVIHTQGGGPLDAFEVENVSGYTSYQGIFTPYRLPEDGATGAKRVMLKNVNLGYDPRMPADQKPLMLLTLGKGNPTPNKYGLLDYTAPEGTTLTNVFLDVSRLSKSVPYYTRVMVAPKPGADGCAAFDAIHKINGKVCDGLPKSGPFAPLGKVGENYDRSAFCTK